MLKVWTFHPLLAAGSLAVLALANGPVGAAQSPAEIAAAEYARVMSLTPNPENGRKVYLTCAVCHRPEGWGSPDGAYPQIAGQLQTVIVKQLADIRARHRENPLMYPFSIPRILGGPQNIADVAAYVAQLPMTPNNGVGPGMDLEYGAQLYQENCEECHGATGMGNADERLPEIAGQHYAYLMRQFNEIRNGRRGNSDSEMVEQIRGFTLRQQSAVLDYTSRIKPPAEKLATPGWTNPDFPSYVRSPMQMGMPVPAMSLPIPPPPAPEPPPMPESRMMPKSPMPMAMPDSSDGRMTQ